MYFSNLLLPLHSAPSHPWDVLSIRGNPASAPEPPRFPQVLPRAFCITLSDTGKGQLVPTSFSPLHHACSELLWGGAVHPPSCSTSGWGPACSHLLAHPSAQAPWHSEQHNLHLWVLPTTAIRPLESSSPESPPALPHERQCCAAGRLPRILPETPHS